MAAAVKISDRDKGYTARLRAIRSLTKAVTSRVGIIGEKAAELHDDESGLTNVELGAIHEFGAGVPARSYIRAFVDETKGPILEQLKVEAGAVVAGRRDVYQALGRFGQWADLQMVGRIARGIEPPLSPVTVARKGHAIPLVDTGKLIGSISSDVARNGRPVK